MQETRVQSLGWKDPLEKEMITHSNILAWRIPWADEPGELQSSGSQRAGHACATNSCLFCLLRMVIVCLFGALEKIHIVYIPLQRYVMEL